MKSFFTALFVLAAGVAPAQSLHFSLEPCIPFQNIAGDQFGRILDPRIDVLRCKRDWDTYFSAQSGMFGGPVVTTAIQPDFKCEQVIAISLGNDSALAKLPQVTEINVLDEYTWEVVVNVAKVTPIETGKGIFSSYVSVRTPVGPNNYRFRFVTADGEQVFNLRSAMDCYRLPRDWWRCHDERGSGRR